MISCVFIQTNELFSEGHKSIYTFKMICTIGARFKHLIFGLKEGIVHSFSPLSFQYYYVANYFTNSLLVKTRGNISEKMTNKMKRRESLKSEPSTTKLHQNLTTRT
jgi:hypothetical protein